MASNKIATVILLDVGAGTATEENGSTFFQRAKEHLQRIVMKKLIAEDTDEMALILFGDNETNNDLYNGGTSYAHTNVVHSLKIPSVKDLFLKLKDLKISTCEISDWVQGCIVAIDLMKNQTKGKRFKTKQIILISNFESEVNYKSSMYDTLIACCNNEKIKLIVLGIDDEYIQNTPSLKPLENVLNQMTLKSLCCNFEDLEDDNKYFDKKRRMKRVTTVSLEIGNDIKIPVGWVKLTSDPHRFKWSRNSSFKAPLSEPGVRAEPEKMQERAETEKMQERAEPEKMQEDDMSDLWSVSSSTEKTKYAKYGDAYVQLSYGDLEALKRKSGPPVFQIFMFTKRKNVNPAMFVGKDVYGVVPKGENKKAQSAFYALIDSMIAANKIAIAKRIAMTNGLVLIGALIPFTDEGGKHMYFLKLPTAEWIQPFPRVRPVESKKDRFAATMDRLINSMMLPSDLLEEDKGVLVPDPVFQLRCHVIAGKLSDPECNPTVPDFIQEILNPQVADEAAAKEVLHSLLDDLHHLNTDVRFAENEPGRVPRLKALVRAHSPPPVNNNHAPSTSKALPPSTSKALPPSAPNDTPSDLLNSQVSQGDSEDIKKAFFN